MARRAGGRKRKAQCGHYVPWHPGNVTYMCKECRGQRDSRTCGRDGCGNSLAGRPASAMYCSIRCGMAARGEPVYLDPPSPKVCALPECTVEFVPVHSRQRCCCENHGKILCNRVLRAEGRMAPHDPEKRRRNLRRKTQRRRAIVQGVAAETVDRDVVGERDQWRCGICRKKVDRSLPWPHPKSASLDHIVPISEHGPHTYANCRIAHLDCNMRRSNKGGNEQLALIG